MGLGGEIFNQIGRAIKAGSPFRHTFVITHCNGAAGYLIKDEAPERIIEAVRGVAQGEMGWVSPQVKAKLKK